MYKPKNWPEQLIYSSESIGVDVDIALLRPILTSNRPEDLEKIAPCIEEKRAHPHLEIRKITPLMPHKRGDSHPLIGQYGVFATKKIFPNEPLGEFVGEVSFLSLSAAEEKKGQSYNWIANWKNQGFFCIDSRRIGNELAYVNDYRGLKQTPNASVRWILHRGIYYFGYVALEPILPNEEILIDYGPEWGDYYNRVFIEQVSGLGAR